MDGAWLNPKHFLQWAISSQALKKEGSTTIPWEVGMKPSRSGQPLTRQGEGEEIVYACMKVQEEKMISSFLYGFSASMEMRRDT